MLLLFDIDGTLLTTGGSGFGATLDAFERVVGRRVEAPGQLFAGGLDPLIFRELCRSAGVAEERAASAHDDYRRLYGELLEERLRVERGASALPGTQALVRALLGRPEVTLGLLTGNYPETGRAKITAAGFTAEHFRVCAWGTDGATRRDLPPVALRRYRDLHGRTLAPEHVVVLGDTPKDVDCARHNGCRALAVATGRYGVRELEQAGAHAVFEDLSDTAAVLAWLASGGAEPVS